MKSRRFGGRQEGMKTVREEVKILSYSNVTLKRFKNVGEEVKILSYSNVTLKRLKNVGEEVKIFFLF